MVEKNSVYAKAYYQAMNDKNLEGVEKYLHADVRFISPITEKFGKKATLEAINGFQSYLKTLTIREIFDSEDQAMLAYDVNFPEPIGTVRSAALMTFKDGLATRIELFFDARSFDKKG